jgi:predicted transcriptional regulator
MTKKRATSGRAKRPASDRESIRPSKRRSTRLARGRVVAESGGVTVTEVEELEALRREIERAASKTSPLRWNANPEEVQRSVAQLVLTLVDFIRQLLERQAIRRMEAGTLNAEQTEDVGRALMQLESTIRDLAARFGIPPDDLNLDLGPIGKLM